MGLKLYDEGLKEVATLNQSKMNVILKKMFVKERKVTQDIEHNRNQSLSSTPE